MNSKSYTYIIILGTWIGAAGCVLIPSVSYAAVQLGYYMDFTLSDGTKVRVFPEAASGLPSNPPIAQPTLVNRKLDKKDSCDKLAKEYKQRSGQEEEKRRKLANALSRISSRPRWVRGLKNVKFFMTSATIPKRPPSGWYYLPSRPRLAFKDGVPQATLVKFITDEASGNKAAEGGLFHMMVTYGLTKGEENELRGLLAKSVPGAHLRGMVDLEPAKGDNFTVVSGTLSDNQFTPKGILTSGRAPTMPGSLAAMAGRLSSTGAQLLAATFENPTADLSVTFAYDYIAKAPAYNAKVMIDLDKIRETATCTLKTHDTQRGKLSKGDKFYNSVRNIIPVLGLFTHERTPKVIRISQAQKQEMYDMLLNVGAIRIIIDQNLPDVDVSSIESNMMDMVMNSFLEMQRSFSQPAEHTNDEGAANNPSDTNNNSDANNKNPNSDNWEVFKVSRKRERMTGHIELNVNKTIAITRAFQMTGNMGADLKKYKKDVFSEVVLNDPFFKRGTIYVELDPDAIELFGKNMVNNASVKLYVPFKNRPFTDEELFTRQGVQSGKISSLVTYATRGKTDNSSCPIQYTESWSMRGGGAWPKDPKPVCSKEANIELVPPIEARTIDVEADLGEMKAVGITAADVRFRYTLYGRTKTKDVRFRIAKPVPYVETTLFEDKPQSYGREPVVEYSIVMFHKTKGELPPSPWRKLDADYVYANITGLPKDYLNKLKQNVKGVKDLLGG